MSLSPLPRVSSRSRGVRTRRSRRDRRQPIRVNERAALTIRDTFHLTSSLAPRRPLERPAPDSPAPRLGHRGVPVVDTFSPACGSLRIPPTARPPSTCPAANGCHASLGLGIARRLLQPVLCDARAHPTSLRSSHASGAFAPLLAGTNRCRLRRPRRCVAAPGACEPRPARLGFHRCVPLAWTRQIAGRSARAKASRALFDDVARALLVALRAPGSPVRFASRFGGPRGASPRPRLPSDAAPRRATPSKESGCLLPRRNPYASGGWLLRARLDRGSVTPPPWRHCSGARAPLSPFQRRLLLTRKAPEPARPTEPWEPKPPLVRPVAAPDTASTTESARGLMCRELHGPFLLRIRVTHNKKNTRTMLFFIHFLPTGLSTACPLFPGFSPGFPWVPMRPRDGDSRAGARTNRIDCL